MMMFQRRRTSARCRYRRCRRQTSIRWPRTRTTAMALQHPLLLLLLVWVCSCRCACGGSSSSPGSSTAAVSPVCAASGECSGPCSHMHLALRTTLLRSYFLHLLLFFICMPIGTVRCSIIILTICVFRVFHPRAVRMSRSDP